MAKRKKASVFNDDDGTGNGDHGFMDYVREKAEQSRKKAREGSEGIDIAKNEVRETEISKYDEPEPRGSKYMDRLLESKRRRELDRLHAQSIKTQLERKLEGSDDVEEIITDGYHQKKQIYEEAEELAQDEQKKELEEDQNSIWGADGVALKMIATEKQQVNHPQSYDHNRNASKPENTVTHFKNDVYTDESILTENLWDKQDDLNSTQMMECVKQFLKSRKTNQDIDVLVKQYWERRNGITH